MTGRLALGFDLGGTQVRAALVQDGVALRKAALRTDVPGGPTAIMAQIAALAREVNSDGAAIAALGMAAPGPLDTIAGVIIHITTLPGFENFPLRATLSDMFGLPAIVENDGIAAAYGEWQFGAGRGTRNMIYATVSTGLGGGVVMDGHLLHGARGMAAHIGHMHISLDGPVCACGGTGCFEVWASGSALGERGRAHAAAQPDGWLGRAARQRPVDSRDVVAGARAHDPDCLALLADEARLLGTGFTSLAHLYSPERIIMGGGVSQAFDLLQDGIHATIRREALDAFKNTPVVKAELGDNAGLIGVASLALAN